MQANARFELTWLWFMVVSSQSWPGGSRNCHAQKYGLICKESVAGRN